MLHKRKRYRERRERISEEPIVVGPGSLLFFNGNTYLLNKIPANAQLDMYGMGSQVIALGGRPPSMMEALRNSLVVTLQSLPWNNGGQWRDKMFTIQRPGDEEEIDTWGKTDPATSW